MSGKPFKYCLSLLPATAAEIWENQEQFQRANLLEIRLDLLRNKIDLQKLRQVITIPLIITIRSRPEGGEWQGSEQEKIAILQAAVAAGIDYLDIEWSEAARILPALHGHPGTQLILSHHTIHHELEYLQNILQQMLQQSAAIYKFIFTAKSLVDNITAFRLIEIARQKKVRYVIHALGKEGLLSRLSGALQGNEFTYVSLTDAGRTAEGQISLRVAREVFFLHEKTEQTRLIGLVGYPVEQSSGWRLHNRLMHIKRPEKPDSITDFIYLNFPASDFDHFWEKWESRISGLSITLPHKAHIISRLDFLARSVEKSGVCNTALKKNGKWWGFNTDLIAIYEVLQPYRDLLQEGLLIFGAGATSRSAIAAGQELGVSKIFITSRDEAKGTKLAEEFRISYLPHNDWLKQPLPVIIQTTPLGMHPAVQEMPPLSALLPRAKLVFDVIYNPALTRLLQEAKKVGCQIISGEEMYLRQARQQFQIFSGIMTTLEELQKVWREIQSESSELQ